MNIKKKNEAEIKCLLNLNKNPLLENNLYKSFSLLYFILEKNTRKEVFFMQYINANEYSNQKQIILEHIKQIGNISTLEGYNYYKIMRVGSVINLLRKEGYNISTVMEHNKRTKKRYARYYLNEKGCEKNEIL